LGDYPAADTAAQRAIKLSPINSNNLVDVLYCQQWLNRPQEALAIAQEAHAKNVSSPWIPLILYKIAFLEHDDAEMERQATSPIVKPVEDMMLFLQSETAASAGEFAKSRELNRRAIDTALRTSENEAAAEYQAHAAVREALAGNTEMAKQDAGQALARANGKHIAGFAAMALALAGDAKRAEHLADELGKLFPQDTVVRFDYLPLIYAALALRSSDAAKAIDALEASAPYELGQTNATFTFALYPVYLRGEVYLAANRGDAAAKEFQKILNHRCVVGNEPIGALAHLGLGRAYALSGDSAGARAAYQKLFRLWKDADPEVPIFQQARAEYAKLRDS
jgi:tetratricopeptide (TPR) repeat protein